jgi:hypothetical protein
MRPTAHEKVVGRNLPGTVWLPAIPKLTAAWRDVLLSELHTISPDDLICARCGGVRPCGCEPTGPRVCFTCGLPKPCQCDDLGRNTEPTHSYAFGESDLTGVYRNGVEVSVSAYQIVHDALVANGQPELIPLTAGMVQMLRHVHTAGQMTNLFTHINKDPQS